MSLVIKFYFSSMLNMFRTLIHPSSGACEFFYCITTLVVCSVKMVVFLSIRANYSIRKIRSLLMIDVLMSETCVAG
jgi:hypothetical protein